MLAPVSVSSLAELTKFLLIVQYVLQFLILLTSVLPLVCRCLSWDGEPKGIAPNATSQNIEENYNIP